MRRGADGSIEVEVPCANVPAFRSWVLGLLDHAEVVGPPDVARRRRRLARRAGGRPMTPTGRRTAEDRLRGLLVMLPWLMERGEVPLAEVARHFRMPPEQVVADLELAAMCGLPPFVDEMIDVFIDDDTVVVGVPRLFTRPLRLTAPEGFALVAAGRAAMQLPGADPEGPLGRGLQKLAAALGDDGVVVDIPIEPGAGGVDRRRDRRCRRCRAAGRRVLDAVARRGDGAHDHAAAGLQRSRRVVRRRRRRALR